MGSNKIKSHHKLTKLHFQRCWPVGLTPQLGPVFAFKEIVKNDQTLLLLKTAEGEVSISNGYSDQVAEQAVQAGNFYVRFTDQGGERTMTCDIASVSAAPIDRHK